MIVENGIAQEFSFVASISIGDVELGRRRADPVHQHDALCAIAGCRTWKDTLRQCVTCLMRCESERGKPFQQVPTIEHDSRPYPLDELAKSVAVFDAGDTLQIGNREFRHSCKVIVRKWLG